MSEPVWTEMVIGGHLALESAESFAWIIENTFPQLDPPLDLEALGSSAEALKLRGLVNYANPEELEAFCEEHGLTYRVTWEGLGGVCEPGMKFWRPGMETPDELPHIGGKPAATLDEIQRAITGNRISALVARLSAAVSAQVPALARSSLSPAEVQALNAPVDRPPSAPPAAAGGEEGGTFYVSIQETRSYQLEVVAESAQDALFEAKRMYASSPDPTHDYCGDTMGDVEVVFIEQANPQAGRPNISIDVDELEQDEPEPVYAGPTP